MNYVNIKYSGYINVTEEIIGDLEFVIEGNRCTMDMKTCEKDNNLNVGGMCQKFEDKFAFYTGFFDSITPKWKCPIKPGIYTVHDGSMDLAIISLLPLDNKVFITTFRLVYGEKGKKAKKIAMCLNVETKVFRTNKKALT